MQQLIRKYCGDNHDLEHVLLVHCGQVAEKALKVIKKHPELSANATFTYEAAMLHDIGITQCNAPLIFCFGTHSYIEHGYLGAEILRKENLPKHALVAERHTGTGITAKQISEQNLPIPLADYSPQSIEEQIICYADKFYSKTKLDTELTVERIREKLSKFGEESLARFDRWHELFG